MNQYPDQEPNREEFDDVGGENIDWIPIAKAWHEDWELDNLD